MSGIEPLIVITRSRLKEEMSLMELTVILVSVSYSTIVMLMTYNFMLLFPLVLMVTTLTHTVF